MALSKWKHKVNKDRDAINLYEKRLQARAFYLFIDGLQAEKESQLLSDTADELRRHSVKRRVLQALLTHKTDSQQDEIRFIAAVTRSRLRACLHALQVQVKKRILPYRLDKASTIKCLQVWIEGSQVANEAQEIWLRRPDLQMRGMLDVNPDAKIDSPLPLFNYMEVARNKNRKLFVYANETLARDLMARVLWALRHEKIRIKHFKQV